MVSKRKLATTAVASFGAALTSMYVAPELQADILDLTFSPASVGAQSVSVLVNVQINPGVGSFSQWNDSIGATVVFNGGLASWTQVQYSQSLSVNGFAGNTGNMNLGSSGTAYVGFRSNAGNVGWFQIDFGGPGADPIIYGPGEYGSMGETVHVGGTTIPEPSGLAGLAMLALGAAGTRRNRMK